MNSQDTLHSRRCGKKLIWGEIMKIVADSSCDLNEDIRKELGVNLVPLTIMIDGKEFRDDSGLNVKVLMDTVEKSKDVVKSACPSPQDFINAFEGVKSVFVVTMTSALSGTYNSAMIAKDLYLSEGVDRLVHVFDSKGSSAKETVLAMMIKHFVDEGHEFMEVVTRVNDYLTKQKYYFQLGSLDAMIKNGRIPKLKGMVASALNIKPILYANEHGEVALFENVRSEKKSIQKFVDLIGVHCEDCSDRILGISHCDALEKAEQIKREVEARYNFKKIVIVPTGGLSSVYTSRGGITMAF